MDSILADTKRILGLELSYTHFDLDITTHLNMALSNLNQLGVGPAGGFVVDNIDQKWADLELPTNQLGLVKTYLYLKVRSVFDPPTTSFAIEAMDKQIKELEWRLTVMVDEAKAQAVP